MKTLKIIGCIALIAAAFVYAAKTTYVITTMDGTVSFQDTKENAKKGIVPQFGETNGWAWIGPIDSLKSQIVLMGVTGNPSLALRNGAKQVKTKLAKGVLVNLKNAGCVGTLDALMPGPALPAVYTAGSVAQFNLKGVNVGTVFARDMSKVAAESIVSVLGDGGAKGKGQQILAISKTAAFIGGTDSNNVGVIAQVPNATAPMLIKKIDSKNTMGFLNLNGATPVKVGKTLVKAKVANTLPVYGTAANWKTKNVTITVGP